MKIPTIEQRIDRLQHEIEKAQQHPDAEVRQVVIAALEDRLAALERVLGLHTISDGG